MGERSGFNEAAPVLRCIWNAANQHLQNALSAKENCRCEAPATVIYGGWSFCEAHLAEHLRLVRERREREWAARFPNPL